MTEEITRDMLTETDFPPDQLDLFDLLPEDSCDESSEVATQARDPTDESGKVFSNENARSLYRKSRDLVLRNFKTATHGKDFFTDVEPGHLADNTGI